MSSKPDIPESQVAAELSAIKKNYDIYREDDEKSDKSSISFDDFDSAKSEEVVIENLPKEDIGAQFKITPNDTCDPSYTNLKLPYSVICRQRLHDSANAIREQFFKELRFHELYQQMALDGERVHREFCDATVRMRRRKKCHLTKKQERRLEQLLAGP